MNKELSNKIDELIEANGKADAFVRPCNKRPVPESTFVIRDPQVADMIRIKELEAREKSFSERLEFEEIKQLVFRQMNIPSNYDIGGKYVPFETHHRFVRLAGEEYERRDAERRKRDKLAEQQKQHEEWLAKQEKAAQDRLVEIENNKRLYPRPETVEEYDALPAEFKVQLFKRFGSDIRSQIKGKPKGTTWERWEALQKN
jgi:hypothetical protein